MHISFHYYTIDVLYELVIKSEIIRKLNNKIFLIIAESG